MRILILILIICGWCYSQTSDNPQTAMDGGSSTLDSSQVDSLSRQLSSTSNTLADFYNWYRGYITVDDDTLQVSTSISFTAGKTWDLYPGEKFKIEPTNSHITNFYIRLKSLAGTAVTWRWGLGGY